MADRILLREKVLPVTRNIIVDIVVLTTLGRGWVEVALRQRESIPKIILDF